MHITCDALVICRGLAVKPIVNDDVVCCQQQLSEKKVVPVALLCNGHPVCLYHNVHRQQEEFHRSERAFRGQNTEDTVVLPGLVRFVDFPCVCCVQNDNLAEVNPPLFAVAEVVDATQEFVAHGLYRAEACRAAYAW